MLTHRRHEKTLVQEANRAGSRVASQARDVASGAGEVARTAKSEFGGLRRHARRRAERKVTGARRSTANRIQGTASRLSSAAEVVENGRRRKRRWPRMLAFVGLIGAAAVVVAQRARSMVQRDATGASEAEAGQTGQPDPVGQRAQPAEAGGADSSEPATSTSSPGRSTAAGANRQKVASGPSTARGNGGR